ncbi:MAG: DUF799 family lipoprotein, partial [Prevotellaceae bacterium]|nr:DUF799 family lipoprotein [Prevotellaceae bacterium]
MRNLLLIIFVLFFAAGCSVQNPITKSAAYAKIYTEKPTVVLIMPPINKSTNVDAKEYFYSTLSCPIANAGYYVIPPFLSMEILKKESGYDAEMFLSSPLTKFGNVFGADLAVFTIIHTWDKSGIAGRVDVEIEYIIKSIRTNETVYSRKGYVVYNTSVNVGG